MSARSIISSDVFSQEAMGQALSHAIPIEAIIEEVLGGDGGPTPSSIVPSNAFWTKAELNVPDVDLEKARGILRDAGFTWGGERLLHFPE